MTSEGSCDAEDCNDATMMKIQLCITETNYILANSYLKVKSSWPQTYSTLLKIKLLCLHIWFHEEPLDSTKCSFLECSFLECSSHYKGAGTLLFRTVDWKVLRGTENGSSMALMNERFPFGIFIFMCIITTKCWGFLTQFWVKYSMY